MQYTFHVRGDLMQAWNLTFAQAATFDFLASAHTWAQKSTDGFSFVAIAKIETEIGYLVGKRRNIQKHLNALDQGGLIERRTDGIRLMIRVTAEGQRWFENPRNTGQPVHASAPDVGKNETKPVHASAQVSPKPAHASTEVAPNPVHASALDDPKPVHSGTPTCALQDAKPVHASAHNQYYQDQYYQDQVVTPSSSPPRARARDGVGGAARHLDDDCAADDFLITRWVSRLRAIEPGVTSRTFATAQAADVYREWERSELTDAELAMALEKSSRYKPASRLTLAYLTAVLANARTERSQHTPVPLPEVESIDARAERLTRQWLERREAAATSGEFTGLLGPTPAPPPRSRPNLRLVHEG